jgi:hypothetical protein
MSAESGCAYIAPAIGVSDRPIETRDPLVELADGSGGGGKLVPDPVLLARWPAGGIDRPGQGQERNRQPQNSSQTETSPRAGRTRSSLHHSHVNYRPTETLCRRGASPASGNLPRPSPLESRAQALFEQRGQLALAGESPVLLLAEDGLGVQGDLEGPLAARPQFDSGQDRRVTVQDFGRLTDGAVQIVSRNAELDGHLVLLTQHLIS